MHMQVHGYIVQPSYSYNSCTKHPLPHVNIEDLHGHPSCVHVAGTLIAFAMLVASCLTTSNHLAAACTMKSTTISVLLLSILAVGVAPRQLLDADVDAALEHQRILAELEEVHQLRERMLQQGKAFCVSGGHTPGCCAPQLCL